MLKKIIVFLSIVICLFILITNTTNATSSGACGGDVRVVWGDGFWSYNNVDIYQGTTKKHVLTIKNVGITPDTYKLSYRLKGSNLANWVSIKLPEELHLAPKEYKSFEIVIDAPLFKKGISSYNYISVSAKSKKCSTLMDSEYLHINVNDIKNDFDKLFDLDNYTKNSNFASIYEALPYFKYVAIVIFIYLLYKFKRQRKKILITIFVLAIICVVSLIFINKKNDSFPSARKFENESCAKVFEQTKYCPQQNCYIELSFSGGGYSIGNVDVEQSYNEFCMPMKIK